MTLSPVEVQLIDELRAQLDAQYPTDELMLRYYQGQQRVKHLGMAIPPKMRRFLVIANWCRAAADAKVDRQQVRSLILPGEETADPDLRAVWDANNLDAHLRMFNLDRSIYGRALMSVGANEADESRPLVRVESPREMVAKIDSRREVVTAAARFYGVDEQTGASPTSVTLYLPDVTVWVVKRHGRWYEVDRDEHFLGVVPVIVHLNRRMTGSWAGESELTDMIGITDSVARTLTNMQFAQEAHGIPRMWMTGVGRGDFVDQDGKPIPQFEAYFDAIHTLTKEGAKVGQLDAADLKNFETAINVARAQAVTVTGLPSWYFGDTTIQPPTEGSVVGSESRLIRSVEATNADVGKTLGWTGALALRFARGEWVEGNRVKVEWHNPATPTVAQRMDATVKAYQAGIISREGAWDELGWSDARKAKERAYFAAEADDPVLAVARDLAAGGTSAARGDG